jgi:hypothetical protein
VISFAIAVIGFYVVMAAGDHLSLGPLDLATADRLALGLWAAAPVVGGLLAGLGGSLNAQRAGMLLGGVIGLTVVLFFLLGAGTGSYTCAYDLGAMPRPLGVLFVGALTGIGIGLGFIVSALAVHRRITALPGVVLAFAIVLASSVGAKDLFYEAVRCLN